MAEEASDSKNIERDVVIQDQLLSILYVKRRQNINDPGIGSNTILNVCQAARASISSFISGI
jgi:hypothetical protein